MTRNVTDTLMQMRQDKKFTDWFFEHEYIHWALWRNVVSFDTLLENHILECRTAIEVIDVLTPEEMADYANSFTEGYTYAYKEYRWNEDRKIFEEIQWMPSYRIIK